MLIRIISSLLAIPLLLFVVFKGGIILKIAVCVLALIGINEFFNAFHQMDMTPSKGIGFLSILLMFGVTLKTVTIESILLWFFLSMFLILLNNLYKEKIDIISSGITIMGIYYVAFFMYHIVFITDFSRYEQLIWIVFISAWGTDTFAYFTGYFLGSKKLCPNISPKKTVEGALGGILGSVLLSTLFSYYVFPEIVIHCMIMGLLGSVMGQCGDLTASIVKRYVGIKDYGKIMPGHGGILDRFDSILFTAPTVYYYVVFFIKP